MKILKGVHLTQTDKKAIKYMIKNNMAEGQTKIKYFKLTLINEDKKQYHVFIKEKYKNDFGAIRFRTSNLEIQL